MLFNQGSQMYFRKSFQTHAWPENDCICQLTPLPSTSQRREVPLWETGFCRDEERGKIGT